MAGDKPTEKDYGKELQQSNDAFYNLAKTQTNYVMTLTLLDQGDFLSQQAKTKVLQEQYNSIMTNLKKLGFNDKQGDVFARDAITRGMGDIATIVFNKPENKILDLIDNRRKLEQEIETVNRTKSQKSLDELLKPQKPAAA